MLVFPPFCMVIGVLLQMAIFWLRYLQDDEDNEEEGGLSKSGKELKKLLGRAAGLNESDADEDEEEEVLIHSIKKLIF